MRSTPLKQHVIVRTHVRRNIPFYRPRRETTSENPPGFAGLMWGIPESGQYSHLNADVHF